MNYVDHKITLDVCSTADPVVVQLKKKNSARRILVYLTEKGKPYHIDEDCYAVFTAQKPDGKIIYNDCTIDGDTIIYEVTDQTTAAVGLFDADIIMMGSNCSNMGTPGDTSDDVSTMCGAMRYCMEKLCYYGRRIPIGVIIPFRAEDDGTEVNKEFQYIEQIAKEYSVPTLNLYTEGRIIPDSMTPDGKTFYLGDSVHLGGNGNLHVERIIGKWIAYQL